ncbi:MAG: ribonuclease Z [Tissierellaceae bacterium]|nr:ribonuclease Z [Tissierellaceae bacterium]
MLDLTLLGCGGGLPMSQRFLSSMMISYRGRKILIDCGEGTQVSMRQFNTGFKSLDIICITHAHGDHIYGLPGLLSTLGNSDRTEPITIIGPKGIKEIMENIVSLVPNLPYELDIIESTDEQMVFRIKNKMLCLEESINEFEENIIISTIDLEHSIDCKGYKFHLTRRPKFLADKAIDSNIPQTLWSKLQSGGTIELNDKVYYPDMLLGDKRLGIKLSYITDTRPTESTVEFIKESDLLVCEGTYGDEEDIEKAKDNKHMTFSEAATLAYKAKVSQLLLTHFSPSIDEPHMYLNNAEEIFKNTIIGFDGFRKTLRYE